MYRDRRNNKNNNIIFEIICTLRNVYSVQDQFLIIISLNVGVKT